MQNETRQPNTEQPKRRKVSHRVIWFLVFLLLAGLTLYAIICRTEDFSSQRMLAMLRGASPFWIACAFLCMLGFILFEALSLRHLAAFLGHKRSFWRNTVYSSADIYFSAITPSATGGQPASALFMLRDKIPGAVTTMVLLLNIMLYTISLLVMGVLCFALCPGAFFSFSGPSRILILVGFLIQALFVVALLLLILKEKIILRVANAGLTLLHRLHLMRNVEKRRESLHHMAEEYRECIHAFRNGKGVVFRVFLLNMLQRFCNIGVTLCVFLAIGGSPVLAREILVTQGFVVLGSNAVPIPGAVGVSDGLFLDGFRDLMPNTPCAELLSRGISFYVCLLFCGLLFLIATVGNTMRKRRKAKKGS